jgi:hypothetical protein
MNLKEFKIKFTKIMREGWIKSQRSGDTGVGHTLESKLGLKENNDSAPDIENHELKAKRKKEGKQTLFTYEGDWHISNLSFINNYGHPHQTSYETSANMTVKETPNVHGIYLDVTNTDELILKDREGEELVSWNWNKLVGRFLNKFPNALQVTADTKKKKGIEYFHYNSAILLKGVNKSSFKKLIQSGDIIVEFRLRTNDNGVRNRGTAFRIPHSKFNYLFKASEVICACGI